MITRMLKELEETWNYTTEELNDIREKMEEIAHEYYWQGFNDGNENDLPKVEQTYGRKEDQEDS